jgi:hypothetical protein
VRSLEEQATRRNDTSSQVSSSPCSVPVLASLHSLEMEGSRLLPLPRDSQGLVCGACVPHCSCHVLLTRLRPRTPLQRHSQLWLASELGATNNVSESHADTSAPPSPCPGAAPQL